MQILRIEDDEGRGAYYPRAQGSAHYAHDNGNVPIGLRHPEPLDDPLLAPIWEKIADREHPDFPYGWVRFGFRDVNQYHAWFYTPESREILRKIGLKVSVYEVPKEKAVIGDSQVIFVLKSATKIRVRECDAPTNQLWTTDNDT